MNIYLPNSARHFTKSMLPVLHFQGALYFGVEMLLTRCKTWFSNVASSEVPPQIQLDDMIYIWSFGLEHGEILSEITSMIRTDKNPVHERLISFSVRVSSLTVEIGCSL